MGEARDGRTVEAVMVNARGLAAAFAAATLVVIGCGGDSTKEGASAGAGTGGGRVASAAGAGGHAEAGHAGGGAAGAGSPVAPPRIAGCTAEPLPAGTSLRGIWIGPAGEVWVAGEGGFVGRRLESGPWSWCRPGAAVPLDAIWGSASDDIWAVGSGGTILRWNGSAWATVTGVGAPAPGNLHDVWGDAGSVWVVGDAGVVRRFDGTNWHVADADAGYTLRGVWGSPSGVLRVVGGGVLPIVYIDPGAEAVVLRENAGQEGAWTREAAFPETRGAAQFLRMSGTSDDDVWACGVKYPSGAAASFAFAARFDGATWTARAGSGVPDGAPQEVLGDRAFTDVAVGPPDAPAGAWFAADLKNAVRFDGTTWTSDDPLTTELEAIDVRGSAMWAAGRDGKILRWNGQAWEISNPAAPLPPTP